MIFYDFVDNMWCVLVVVWKNLWHCLLAFWWCLMPLWWHVDDIWWFCWWHLMSFGRFWFCLMTLWWYVDDCWWYEFLYFLTNLDTFWCRTCDEMLILLMLVDEIMMTVWWVLMLFAEFWQIFCRELMMKFWWVVMSFDDIMMTFWWVLMFIWWVVIVCGG